MDPERILGLPKIHRRTFVALLFALLVVVILLDLRLETIPVQEMLAGYLRAVAAAILTSLFVLWIVASFLPSSRSKASLFEIEARKITKEFDELLRVATRWRYKGNFGRYMRGKVLPTLAGRPNFHISVCVIDPTLRELCEEHARYRSRINAIDKGRRYDADTVAVEILVTIVICAWYVANKGAAIELYLSRVFDPVRIDSNDEAMILTVEDRRSPALKVTQEHFTYKHFDLQMQFARSQARRVHLAGMRENIELPEIEEGDVVEVLREADMHELCERLTVKRILQTCRESKNPYAN